MNDEWLFYFQTRSIKISTCCEIDIIRRADDDYQPGHYQLYLMKDRPQINCYKDQIQKYIPDDRIF